MEDAKRNKNNNFSEESSSFNNEQNELIPNKFPNKRFYIKDIGEQSWDELKKLVTSGSLKSDTMVYVKSKEQWIRSKSLPGLINQEGTISGWRTKSIDTLKIMGAVNLSISFLVMLWFIFEDLIPIGFIIMVQGIVVYAFFHVIAGIAEDLIQIRKNTTPK